jgi:hypothetical protein
MAGRDTATRYYAFSKTDERIYRIPLTHTATDATAIAWADAKGADNVMREDGPKAKPVTSRIWERTPSKPTRVTVWDANGVAYTVSVSALTRMAMAS